MTPLRPEPSAPTREGEADVERGHLVLVVEDETVLRATMVRALGRLPGIEVVDASTVREGGELLRALNPDLLVTDLDLPDGSGVELIALVDRRRKPIPILVVSAYVGRFRMQLQGHPHVEVHDKPMPLSELRARVRDRLGAAPAARSLPFSAADYIQLACQGRHSVVIVTSHDGNVVGRIVVCQGEVWSAEDPIGQGDAALRRLLFDDGVTIDVRTLLPDQAGARSLFGAWQTLLLEAARLHDETMRARGTSDSPPPPPQPPRTTTSDAQRSRRVSVSSFEDIDFRDVTPSALAPIARGAPAEDVASREVSRRFEEVYDEAVEALLSKRYANAYRSFLAASALRPDDPRVAANLRRLREMGHGGTP